MSKHKTILVCGGSGFMGSNFVRYIYEKYPEYKIYNLDLLTYAGNLENLKDIENKEKQKEPSKKRYTFIKGDIGNKALLEFLFSHEKFDIVINFAAESHVDRSIINSIEFIKTNIHGAYILLEEVRAHKIPKFIYISTDEVYGDIPKGIVSSENFPLQPTNPYSASKASADLMVQSYMKTHRVPAIILRSSNNYGPYQYPEKLHALVITNLIEDKKIPIHGKGNHARSWIHVWDFCKALDLIMHEGKNFNIYNISGEEKTTLEIVNTVMKIMGKNRNKYIAHVHDRPGADFRYSPDDRKIRKELGWKREYSYETSIKRLVEWYTQNRKWWLNIRKRPDFKEHYKKQIKGYYTFEEGPNYKRQWIHNKVRRSKIKS